MKRFTSRILTENNESQYIIYLSVLSLPLTLLEFQPPVQLQAVPSLE